MSILSNSFIQYIIDFLKPKIEAKQDKLISGTNIKTINGTSLLGSGDIIVVGGSGGSTDKHGAAYPYGNNDKPYHKVASVSNVVSATLNTNISFYVSEYYKDTSCGILNISLRWNANSDKFYFSRIFWSLNVGIDVNDFVLGWSIENSVVTCNLYVKRIEWTSYALKRIDEQAWGNPNDLWQCYNATYPNNCYATIPDANTVVSVNETIANSVNTANTANNANTANKLTTARTISLSGAARGSTTFDGSANNSLDVTTLYEAFMSYGGKAIAGNVSLIDGAAMSELWCNKLAYYNPDYINVEYTNNYSEDADGNESSDVIWTEYPYANENNKLRKLFILVTGGNAQFYSSGSSSNSTAIAGKTRLRITFNSYSSRYIDPKKILVRVSSCTTSLNNQIKIEGVTKANYDAGNIDKFTHFSTNVVSGDAGWNSIPFTSSFGNATWAAIKKLRITFIVNGILTSNTPPALQNIYMIGRHHAATDSNVAAYGRLYDYDYQQNATFPAAITATKLITQDGTANQVVLGDGTLKALSEISGGSDSVTSEGIIEALGYTPADAEYVGNIERNVTSLTGSVNTISTTLDTKASKDVATTSANGLMSSTDKTKLDNIPSTDICSNIVEAKAEGNDVELLYDMQYRNSDGTYSESENESIFFPLATSSAAGMMSKEDKTKLDIIELEGVEGVYHSLQITHDKEASLMSTNTDGSARAFMTAYSQLAENIVQYLTDTVANTAYIAAGANGSTCKGGDSSEFILFAPTSSDAPDECATLTLSKKGQPFIYTDANGITSPKFITTGGTAEHVVLGDGTLKTLSEISGGSGEGSNLDPILTSFVDSCKDAGPSYYIPTEEMFRLSYMWDSEYNEGSIFYDYSNTVNSPSAIRLWYDNNNKPVWEFIDNVAGAFAPSGAQIPVATQEQGGLMSPEDKAKLDGLSANGGSGDYLVGLDDLSIDEEDIDTDLARTELSFNINSVYPDGKKNGVLCFQSQNLETGEITEIQVPVMGFVINSATKDKAGLMSADDKAKLDSLFGMSISGTVNLTTGTFNTTNNTSLNSYSEVFNNMKVGEMRMYLVSDSSGKLPSTSETYVTVPYDGVLSPAQIYFGKSQAFGVSVGDICVLFKRSSLLNVCRIIPLNDVKAANGDFPGADGLSTVWDKERINKVDGIEWTANHVRDNYLPKNDRFPSRADWLINVDNCINNGVYPTCDAASMNVELNNQYITLVVQRTSTADNGGYHTIEQTAYGRGADEGQVYKRIIFYKSDDTDTQYGEWLLIVKQLVNIKVRVSDTDTFTNVFQTIAEYLMNTTEAEKGEVTVRHAAASVTLGNFTFTCITSGGYTLKGFIDPVFSKNNDTNCTGVIEYGEIFLRLFIDSEGHIYGKGSSLVNGDTWTWEKSEV